MVDPLQQRRHLVAHGRVVDAMVVGGVGPRVDERAVLEALHAPVAAHESDGWEREYRQMMLGASPGRAITTGDGDGTWPGSVRLPVWYGTEEWTVEMWVNISAGADMWSRVWQFGPRYGGVLFFTPSACCGRGYGIWAREGYWDNQWHTVSAHKPWPKYDEWAHLAVTLRRTEGRRRTGDQTWGWGGGQEATVYVDGEEVARGSFSPRMRIFAGWSNWVGKPGSHYPGGKVVASFDEFRVWSYARSHAGIHAGMNRAMLGMEAGLQMNFRFDEKDSRVQFDWSEHYGCL